MWNPNYNQFYLTVIYIFGSLALLCPDIINLLLNFINDTNMYNIFEKLLSGLARTIDPYYKMTSD